MPIVPSRRGEIRELLERLAAGRPAEQEAAAARLRLLGARVLEALAAWLPDAPAPARLLALRVLEGSREARALDLLLPLCQAAEHEVAARAVETLASLANPRVVAALATVTRQGPVAARRAAAEELARLAEDGSVEALDALLELLLDEGRPEDLRRTALPVVAGLPHGEREPLLERLARGKSRGLAAAAERLLGRARLADPAAAVERLLRAGAGELAGALEDLGALGLTGVEAVAARLAQGALGAGQAARLGQALAASRLPAAVPLLHAALTRLTEEPEPARRAASAEARAALHRALARLDSRAGLYDLRELLAARPPRALADLLAAAEAVGDGSVARLLLRLAAEEPGLAAACRAPFGAIVRREKLRRTSRALRGLSPAEEAVLARFWPSRAARRPAP